MVTALAPVHAAGAATTDTCGGRTATILGTGGEDAIHGTAGPDVIVALGSSDTVWGLGGADRICLGRGDDTSWGGPGTDRMYGQDGNDVMWGLGAGTPCTAVPATMSSTAGRRTTTW
jgi:Ca2+-binding RTX toxin-like protein